jgi:hypothetical protein
MSEPQAPATVLPQLSVQSDPALAVSYSSEAVRDKVPLSCTEAVIGATVTIIGGGGATVMVTVAVALGFAVEAATTVTVDPGGILVGAEYTTA